MRKTAQRKPLPCQWFAYNWKKLHKLIKLSPLKITDLFEMLYQTLRRVFHQDIQTLRSL